MALTIKISDLNKTYKSGLKALENINLEIESGEIFALLGPNGAGKTTLISTICGILNPSSGTILVGGFDVVTQFRQARKLVGLVPQELTVNAFETVLATVNFSRGLFGKKRNDQYIEQLLHKLSLWDKRNSQLITLSGGMKRRVMIAKALSHEPRILFLDEPTAGVDVELRKDMWSLVRSLRQSGVTIILTTHYIEEAEEMADRVGVINDGRIILTENKTDLMRNLGTKKLLIDLPKPIEEIPKELESYNLKNSGSQLIFQYDPKKDDDMVAKLMNAIGKIPLIYKDIHTKQSTLEEIFVKLVHKK